MKVSVTDHALHRWRERAAVYGNATVDDVLTAFARSRRLADDELLPGDGLRRSDTHYYRDPESGAYFVVMPVDVDRGVMLTVLADAPKPRLPNVRREAAVLPALAPMPAVKRVYTTQSVPIRDRPRFETAKEERAWLIDQQKLVEADLCRLREEQAPASVVQPIKQRLHHYLSAVMEIKPRYRKECESAQIEDRQEWLSRQGSEPEAIFWPNGSLNFNGAILDLRRRVAELESALAARS